MLKQAKISYGGHNIDVDIKVEDNFEDEGQSPETFTAVFLGAKTWHEAFPPQSFSLQILGREPVYDCLLTGEGNKFKATRRG